MVFALTGQLLQQICPSSHDLASGLATADTSAESSGDPERNFIESAVIKTRLPCINTFRTTSFN